MDIERYKRLLQIIWVAVIGAVGCYWVVHHIVGTVIEPRFAPTFLEPLLALVAVIAMGYAVGWYLLAVRSVARRMTGTSVRGLSDEERTNLVARLFTVGVIGLALLETPALLGLVLSLLGFRRYFSCFAGTSLLGLLLFRAKALPVIFEWFDRLYPRSGHISSV